MSLIEVSWTAKKNLPEQIFPHRKFGGNWKVITFHFIVLSYEREKNKDKLLANFVWSHAASMNKVGNRER